MPVLQGEVTQAQLISGGMSPELARDSATGPLWMRLVREMRRDPTIKLIRALAIAPLLCAEWSVEATDEAPEDAKNDIDAIIRPLRSNLLRTSLCGYLDFGWQGYEKVYQRFDKLGGFMGIKKLKPLLQDLTTILVDIETGAFKGFKQFINKEIILTEESCLLVNGDVEGTYWYGEPAMKAAEVAYKQWNLCNDAAVRYDKKMAGAHWIIHYPPGKTQVNGADIDNFELARQIMNGLQSSGSVIVPRWVEDTLKDASEQTGDGSAWKIELVSAYPTADVAFIPRLKYLDALKARALGMPERATLEGQFGTKAEAEAHADFAITNMELTHKLMVEQYNQQLVNPMLSINYGESAVDTVCISVAPIADLQMSYLRTIYTTFLANAQGFAQEADSIDMNAMRDKLGVPSMNESDKELKDITDPVTAQLSFAKLFKLTAD